MTETSANKYRAADKVQRDFLRATLEKKHGLEAHPKRDALWALAWDYGHGAGYSEVVSYYDDLAELLKP